MITIASLLFYLITEAIVGRESGTYLNMPLFLHSWPLTAVSSMVSEPDYCLFIFALIFTLSDSIVSAGICNLIDVNFKTRHACLY